MERIGTGNAPPRPPHGRLSSGWRHRLVQGPRADAQRSLGPLPMAPWVRRVLCHQGRGLGAACCVLPSSSLLCTCPSVSRVVTGQVGTCWGLSRGVRGWGAPSRGRSWERHGRERRKHRLAMAPTGSSPGSRQFLGQLKLQAAGPGALATHAPRVIFHPRKSSPS